MSKEGITRWEDPNVTWHISSYLFTYLRLSVDSQWTRNNIHIPLNVNLTSHIMYRYGADCVSLLSPLYTIYRVTSYLRLLALSMLTVNPNMSFIAPLISDNSRSLKNWVGGTVLHSTSEEKFMYGVWVVASYLRVRLDLSGSTNFRDIYGFPKLGP